MQLSQKKADKGLTKKKTEQNYRSTSFVNIVIKILSKIIAVYLCIYKPYLATYKKGYTPWPNGTYPKNERLV